VYSLLVVHAKWTSSFVHHHLHPSRDALRIGCLATSEAAAGACC